jgi:hypothetical protein
MSWGVNKNRQPNGSAPARRVPRIKTELTPDWVDDVLAGNVLPAPSVENAKELTLEKALDRSRTNTAEALERLAKSQEQMALLRSEMTLIRAQLKKKPSDSDSFSKRRADIKEGQSLLLEERTQLQRERASFRQEQVAFRQQERASKKSRQRLEKAWALVKEREQGGIVEADPRLLSCLERVEHSTRSFSSISENQQQSFGEIGGQLSALLSRLQGVETAAKEAREEAAKAAASAKAAKALRPSQPMSLTRPVRERGRVERARSAAPASKPAAPARTTARRRGGSIFDGILKDNLKIRDDEQK